MKKTGIAGLENREITQASGGQLQRVGICRALMCNPKIIFGDEPTGALNLTSANEIMALLARDLSLWHGNPTGHARHQSGCQSRAGAVHPGWKNRWGISARRI